MRLILALLICVSALAQVSSRQGTVAYPTAFQSNTMYAAHVVLTQPEWVDSLSPASQWTAGATALSWNTNYCGYKLEKGDIGTMNIQLNHDVVTNATTMYPHVHFLKTGDQGNGGASNMVLQLSFRRAAIGAQWSAWESYFVTNTVDSLGITNVATHNYIEIPSSGISITGSISKCIAVRIQRMNIGDDNYTAGDLVFTHVDIHYAADTHGSKQDDIK